MTGIRNDAHLGYKQANEYLRTLFESGLVEYVSGKRRYKTTEKGLQLLKKYERLNSMVGYSAKYTSRISS